MSRNVFQTLGVSAISIATISQSANAAAVIFVAAGAYDSTSHSNVADRNANGHAINATSITDYAGFKSSISTTGLGNAGVVDFETANILGSGSVDGGSGIPLPTSDSYSIRYGTSGNKLLPVTISTAMRTAFFSSALPLSGTRMFSFGTDTDGSQTVTITFGNIAGGDIGEKVTTIGLTAMSRNATDYTLGNNVTMSVNFSGGSTASLGSLIDSQIGGVNQPAADTFFGFVAPTGQWITSMTVSRQRTIPFDDLGFITAVVPEPVTVCTLATSGALLLRRRRSAM